MSYEYSDVDCPYCGAPNDINHDDGYGYAENEKFSQECEGCGKTFVYTTAIIFDYDAEKAPCLNGGEHKYKELPTSLGTLHECEYCGDQIREVKNG